MKVTKKTDGYSQYKLKGDGFYPMGDTVKTIPAGFYKPAHDSYTGEYFLEKKTIITPKLYLLPNEARDIIVADIQRFWKSEERYRKFQSVYKRNILLYSIPGNGKTCLINLMCKELIEKYNGIIVCIDTHRELDNYTKIMSKFRQVEPDRKIITIIEDFERLAKDEYYSSLLLQLLDGNEQLDSIVTIATTNYPEILEKRFTCRPSRFNLVIEYKKPNADIRKAYIEMKLSDSGIDINDEKVKADIDRYVAKTEGYTFDFVKEVIQGIYVDGISEVAIFDRLEELIKRNGKIKVTEDEAKRIGFTNDEDEDSMQNDCIDEPCTTTSSGTRCNQRPILENRRNVKIVKGFG
jgi:SpoVK/Ycf46/Vps4 family AAA+-type ATPase